MAQSLKTLIGKGGGGGSGATDVREFKNFQDWYGVTQQRFNDIPSNSRDCGNTSGGTGTGPQERKAGYNQTINWTVPDGVTSIRVTCVGAGGGGASRQGAHYYGGGGGQGGGFVSGEVNVSAGQVLEVIVGRGGEGATNPSSGSAGTDTSVTFASANGGSSALSLLAKGGYGGEQSGATPPSPRSGTISGTALKTPNQINHVGGQGGQGSNRAFGFGPEGYGAGGGGSAGSYKAHGNEGGAGTNSGGYSYCSGGGGGIGGKGGNAGSSNSASFSWAHGGGGGGSRGNGVNGSNSDSNSQSNGGQGWSDMLSAVDFTDPDPKSTDSVTFPDDYQRGIDPTGGNYQTKWQGTSYDWWTMMRGTRYGDGIANSPQINRLGGGGGSYEPSLSGGGGSSAGASVEMQAKTFNGIIGRCTGSGGGACSSDNHQFGNKSYPGGEGGSGGGGGGAASSQTEHETSNRSNRWSDFWEWDPTNMAFTASWNDAVYGASAKGRLAFKSNLGKRQALGGAGGALGGGGGCGSYAIGGPGGIGGGGGGGNGHFNTSYGGWGGTGGPGYVMIEW